METFEYVLKDKAGIHARPAGVVVKTAKEFESKITMENKGKKRRIKQGAENLSVFRSFSYYSFPPRYSSLSSASKK